MARYLQYNQPQYVSQFVPEDLNFYQQQLDKSQGRYDATNAMYSEALGKLGELEAYDTSTKQKLIDEFTGKFNKTYDKYKGDLSQATPDIMGLIAQTRSNPELAMLKEQTRLGRQYEDMKRRQPNLWFSNDPTKMSVQGLTDPSQLGFETVNPDDLTKRFMQQNSELKNRVETSDILTDKNGNRYRNITRGQTREQIKALLKDPNTVNAVIDAFPQLEKFKDDPSFKEYAASVINQAAQGLYGGTEIKDLGPDPYDIARYTAGLKNLTTPNAPIPVLNDTISKEEKKVIHEESSPRLGNKISETLGVSKPSTNGYVGTVDNNETFSNDLDKYTTNYIEKELINKNPILSNINQNLIREEDYKTINPTYQNFVKDNIHSWVKDAKEIVEGTNPLRQDMDASLHNIVYSMLSKKYPELNKTNIFGENTKLEKETRDIVAAYERSNSLFKNTLDKEVTNYYNNPLNKNKGDMLLQFTTIDNFDDDARQSLNRLNEINEDILSPSMFVFNSGNLKGKVPEDVQKIFTEAKTYPKIIGIGGNEETGIIFSVRDPNGEVTTASLNTDPEYYYNIASELGRGDLIQKDIIAKNLSSFVPGKNIPIPNNKNIKYYYNPNEGHTGYIENGKDKSFIDYGDMRALQQERQKRNLPVINIDKDKKDSDPYYFDSRQKLMEVTTQLSNIQ